MKVEFKVEVKVVRCVDRPRPAVLSVPVDRPHPAVLCVCLSVCMCVCGMVGWFISIISCRATGGSFLLSHCNTNKSLWSHPD